MTSWSYFSWMNVTRSRKSSSCLDQRGLRNAERGLLLQRLDQDREFEPLRPGDPARAGNDREIRHANPVIAEDLFRDPLVLAERQAGGAAPGERNALQFEKRGDVLVEGAVVFELVGQVEDDVRLELLDLLPDQIRVVEDRQVFGRAIQRLQSRQQVGLGLPIFGGQFAAQILVQRGGPDGVEQGEDFEFAFAMLKGLLGAFEFAGEQIIHDQRGDVTSRAAIRDCDRPAARTAAAPRSGRSAGSAAGGRDIGVRWSSDRPGPGWPAAGAAGTGRL